jgi:hypothetical protein
MHGTRDGDGSAHRVRAGAGCRGESPLPHSHTATDQIWGGFSVLCCVPALVSTAAVLISGVHRRVSPFQSSSCVACSSVAATTLLSCRRWASLGRCCGRLPRQSDVAKCSGARLSNACSRRSCWSRRVGVGGGCLSCAAGPTKRGWCQQSTSAFLRSCFCCWHSMWAPSYQHDNMAASPRLFWCNSDPMLVG